MRDSFESNCKGCKIAKAKSWRAAVRNGTQVDKTSSGARRSLFISAATEAHDGVYTYEKVDYVNNLVQVSIFCTKHSGYFMQSPANHLATGGCKVCGIAARVDARKSTVGGFH
jgi:hypothetical protein